MSETPPLMQHEPPGIATGKVVAATAGFLSLVVLALVLAGIMFWAMQAARGPVSIDMPVVETKPALQVHPAEDLAALRRLHRAQLEAGPVTIDEAMARVSRRPDPYAPLTEAETAEARR